LARRRDHTRDALTQATAHAERPPPVHIECVAGSKFGRPFMQWIKDGTSKTMAAVADEWRRRHGDAR